MEKDHLEMILEDIQSKFELVLEGHEALRKEIRDARNESNEKHGHAFSLIEELNKKIDNVETKLTKRIDDVETKLSKRIDSVQHELTKKIDSVAVDLAAHRADTESHPKGYKVSDR
jgi:chaperonin cofactor prefoldin